MSNFSKLFLILLFAFFSATSQAQNYYVCSNTGDDQNDGKSEEKPFKTFEKGLKAFNSMFAGGSVLFCRGGEFPVTTGVRIYNNKCGKSKPCTISDYGNSSKPKPIIFTEGQTALNFQDGGNADPDGGYVVKNLTLIANSKGDGAGVFIFNDVDDLTLDNLHIEGFRIGVHSAGSNALNTGANGFNDRLLLSNSTIINNHAQGFLGACQDCLIENNVFENNGYAEKILNHNIYIAKSGVAAEGITIRNNVLYKSAIVDGKCSGVSLVAHGLLKDLVIENNTVKEDLGKVSGHCWGISVDPGYSKQEEAFYNVTIKNNKLINVGNVAIGCASCDGVSIVGNEIIDEGDTLIHGIRVPVRQEDAVKSRNIVIKNNKIMLNHLTGFGISIGGEHEAIVSGNEVRLPTATRADCFHKYGVNLLTNTINNLCQTHNGVSFTNSNDEQTESNHESVIDNPIVNEKSEVVESTPVEIIESPDQQLANDDQKNEEIHAISEPSSITQRPIENIIDIDNSESLAIDNPIVNEKSEVAENTPVEIIESPDQQLASDYQKNEETYAISEPSSITQRPIENIIDIDNSERLAIDDPVVNEKSEVVENTPVEIIESPEQQLANDYQKNKETHANSKSSSITQRPNAKSGGGAGGSSSKSKKSTTTVDLAATNDSISYAFLAPNVNNAAGLISTETEQMDIISGLSKTEPESSKYSVKVKDVIEASRQNNDEIDVTQCRAYAAGRCLMK